MIRLLIVFAAGIGWFILTPELFMDFLPSFATYNTLISNMGTDVYAVYQIWTLVPEVFLFMFGIFWAGGLLEIIGDTLGKAVKW